MIDYKLIWFSQRPDNLAMEYMRSIYSLSLEAITAGIWKEHDNLKEREYLMYHIAEWQIDSPN